MHETSLVRSLLNQVGRLLVEHQGTAVEEIRVEIGPLSGVEPALVQSAFDRLAPESPACGSRLRIETVPLTGACENCRQRFTIEGFQFRCSLCGSGNVQVVSGEEFRLIDVTIAQSERTEVEEERR